MNNYFWNDWFSGWGWIIWFWFIFLMFSSFGNWGYTYRAHQRFNRRPENSAFDILDERLARGEIDREQYRQIKSEILNPSEVNTTPGGSRSAVLAPKKRAM